MEAAFRLTFQGSQRSSERLSRDSHSEDSLPPVTSEFAMPVSILSGPSSSSVGGGILQTEPVDWARLKQWDKLHELLTSKAGNVCACDAVGRTALHYAAGYGDREAAAALLAHGAGVNTPDRFGATPLHWACLKAHANVVEELVAAQADPLVRATAGVFSKRSSLDLLSAHAGSSEVSAALTKKLGASLFEQRKILGRGGFGTVIKAVRRDTGLTVALKEVRKPGSCHLPGSEAHQAGGADAAALAAANGGGATALRGARIERDVLSAVSHPFVVQLHGAYQTRNHVYLVLDYCAGGDLALHIRHANNGRLGERAARFVCAELLLALEALHDVHVIHRDVKAENVLVDAHGHIRLADLNTAKRDESLGADGRAYSVVGTPFAAAPEVLLGKGYAFAADWWSYGVLLFEALVGRPPYPNDQSLLHAQARLVHEIVHGERAPLPPGGVSEAAAALLDGLLQRDEYARLARPVTLRAHPFFEGTSWSTLLAKQLPSPLLGRDTSRSQPMSPKSHAAPAPSVPDLDVFAYPSILGHGNGLRPPQSPSLMLPRAFGAAADDAPGGDLMGLDGWEYVADEGAGSRGALLWRRVRARVDQLARLNELSRHSFLICVALHLAAKDATGGGPTDQPSVLAAVEAARDLAGEKRATRPTHRRSLSGPS